MALIGVTNGDTAAEIIDRQEFLMKRVVAEVN